MAFNELVCGFTSAYRNIAVVESQSDVQALME